MKFYWWPIAFLLLTVSLPLDPDRYKWQIMLGTLAFVLFLSWYICEKMHLIAGLLFGYCAISATLISLCPMFPWQSLDQMQVVIFKCVSAQSLLFILAVILPILFTPQPLLEKWLKGFVIIGVITSIFILSKLIRHEKLLYGLLSNSAEDATFLGIIIPYTYSQKRLRPLVLLFGLCLLLAKSSTGFAILALQVALIGFKKLHSKKEKIIYLIMAIVTIPLSGKLILGQKLLNNDGRDTIWKLTADFFNKTVNPITGAGAGSFFMYMPMAQVRHGSTDIFLWAHNDLLQTLFEYGIIGLTLLLILFAVMLYKSRKTPWVTVTLLCMFIGAFLQMPFRLMPLSLFYALMCRISLEGEWKEKYIRS